MGLARACNKPRCTFGQVRESRPVCVSVCVSSCTPSVMWQPGSVILCSGWPQLRSLRYKVSVLMLTVPLLAVCVFPWCLPCGGQQQQRLPGTPYWVIRGVKTYSGFMVFPHLAVFFPVSGVRYVACVLAELSCSFSVWGCGGVS